MARLKKREVYTSTFRTWRPRYMPFFGFTRCGRKALPSVGSIAICGALNALAARRFALRRLDCLRFGLAMGRSVLSAGGLLKCLRVFVERVGVKARAQTRQAPSVPLTSDRFQR